jgi:hypothetical protein
VFDVAVAPLAVSLKCVGLAVVPFVVPSAPSVDRSFIIRTACAVAASSMLLWYVRRARL